ncbi:MAG: branched-chain amino acid ABC transporter permease [Proteobacteria bacterium]|nr:branched-chain amino acid ABC transporter permease [Pseudomonadota bacterium]NIS71053.1 branched-chain amino acid ABC transporter permease [Pseudomonadota bacterium]
MKIDRITWIALIGILILLVLPLFIQSQRFFQFVILILWYAYLTTSWNLVGGFAGVLPLGHATFAGIGAYASSVLFIHYGLTPWAGMFAGAFLAAIVGVIIGAPTFRLRGAYFALATIAICEGFRVVLENMQKFLGFDINGARGILLPLKGHAPIYYQFLDKRYFYYIILVMLVIIFYITYRIARSKLGYYLMAGGEEKEAAEALGINVPRCKLIAMAISTFFTALGGTFYMQLVHYIYPRGIVSLDLSFEIAFIAIIGGRGTLLGPIVGAVLLVPSAELTRTYLGGSYEGIHLMLYGAVLMAVMLFKPRGLMEPLEAFYRWVSAKFFPQPLLQTGKG